MFELLFLPITLVIMLLILVAPLIIIYLFLRLSETAFEMVGFSHWHATLAVFGSILGSLVDFQLISAPISSYPDWYVSLMSLTSQDVSTSFHPLYLAVNLGGCIIPLLVSAHLLLRGQAGLKKAMLGMAVVAGITYWAAEAIPGEGIALPVWLSPLLVAAMGLLLAGGFRRALPPELHQARPLVLSIGGAGVFDGIFLTGIIAVLLAAGIVCLLRGSCKGEG